MPAIISRGGVPSIAIRTGTKCENFRVGKKSVKLALVADGKTEEIEAETVLSAIGVVANIDGVIAPAVAIELDRNYLKVGDDYQTTVKGIYAAGDIIGPPWLAHVATFEAVSAVNGIFGHSIPHRVRNFPGCTYCQPQVASVGLTEAKAKEAGREIKVGRFPFIGNGKAIALGEPDGLVKTIFDAKTGELLGAHMVGAEVTELIEGFVVAMNLETTEEDLIHTIFPHPTLSETMKESVLDAYGRALNI